MWEGRCQGPAGAAGMGRDWRSHRVAVTGLVAAGGEMFWEMDCSGLQGLGDVWKMALEDFFPHLVDLRILILIYGLRFHGFRGRGVECSIAAGEGPGGASHPRMLREVPQRPGPRPPEPRRVPGQPYPVLYITSEMSVKDFNPWNFFFWSPLPSLSSPIC
ncbi:hypothetical protein Nmel_011582 [Mimus melanotis]